MIQTDKNGLRYTTVSNTLNAYLYTAYNSRTERWQACARACPSSPGMKGEFNFTHIHFYKDPRDAAFAAQRFADLYDHRQVRQMMDMDTLRGVIQDFREEITIPVWQWPSHAPTQQEIETNVAYMGLPGCPKSAIRFALQQIGRKPPHVALMNMIVDEMVARYNTTGERLVDIAKQVLQEI